MRGNSFGNLRSVLAICTRDSVCVIGIHDPPKAGLDPSSVRSAQYLANKILYCNIDAFKVI